MKFALEKIPPERAAGEVPCQGLGSGGSCLTVLLVEEIRLTS